MRLRILAFCFAALLPSAPAWAAWPERPIKLIVPFPPGGPNDAVARLVAEPLSQQLGQPVVIDNRAGAGGTIGSDAGAKALPDGYTLTLGSTSSHSLPTLLKQKIGYSPTTSFAPVGLIGRTPTVLLANTRVPARDYRELLALARSQPGRLTYGSSGVGTLNHLISEYFKQPQGQVQLALSMIDGGRNPQAAVDAPRWKLEHKSTSLQLDFEPTFPAAQQQALRDMGHPAGPPGITGADFGGAFAVGGAHAR